MKTIQIADKLIGENQPTFIIAEIGVNHNGSLEVAKKLINAAKETGVDAVKFQTFKTEKLAQLSLEKESYQKTTTNVDENHEWIRVNCPDRPIRTVLKLDYRKSIYPRCLLSFLASSIVTVFPYFNVLFSPSVDSFYIPGLRFGAKRHFIKRVVFIGEPEVIEEGW